MTAVDPQASLSARLRTAPVLMEPDAADKRLSAWLAELAPGEVRALLSETRHRPLLVALADHSPFLWRLVVADPLRCAGLLRVAPERSLSSIATSLDLPRTNQETADDLMRLLRRARQAVALLVALADLGGVWTLEDVTEALTAFAEAAARCCVRFLLREGVRTGKLHPQVEGRQEEAGCGLVVLALGKAGGRELNYSSDIDLVMLFDPQASRLAKQTVPSQFFVRLTQTLVRLMQERTADGYVLRVDLRLRPDPASTAVAIGLPSAFSYYESYGQNWERAAFIKARPIAGDIGLGERFLADLGPFIWRKYFDYAAIADIHAMKRQIHAVRGQADVAVEGHNIKLGRGGIREIEFFVQTQQLIFGGRRPNLRGAQTLGMLAALEADGWIGPEPVAELSAAYRFLRTVEHRLQMVADEQTQRLPVDTADLERFARFTGFANRDAFAEELTGHLRRVEAHYARLFEHAPGLDTAAGSLVFTGTSDDPDTIETLRALGFSRPEVAAETIRGWHFGRRAAVQSARAREVLTELVPGLLDAFASSGDPDAALATTDTMLGRLPAAIELFSLLRSNGSLRNLFADIVGSAPRLAVTIAARPHVLDAAIDPAMLGRAGDERAIAARVHGVLDAAPTTEAFLDRAREIAQEETFLIGVRLLSGTDEPRRAGEALSALAVALVKTTLDRCLADFAAEHGTISGGACMVLAMGKLGSREMTMTSDLDLIVIYRFDPEAGESDGRRPLDGARYYTRVTQRLISALTAPTRRGRLYDVDVRLRPSGRQGPLAVQLSAFQHYQANDAQTWEHMALTRARGIAGDPALRAEVEAVIDATLAAPRDVARLRDDVAAMRALVAREKGDGGVWDMKLAPGGLLDIEFIAQYLALRFRLEQPTLSARNPVDLIQEAASLGVLAAADALLLRDAYRLQAAVAQFTRLTVEGPFDPAKAGAGVLRRLTGAANQPDLSALRSALAELRVDVRALMRRLLEWPETRL